MDLDDLLPEPVVENSRARVKFQPKARPKSNVKVAIVSASGQCDSANDKPVITDPNNADTSSFVSRLDPPIEIASVNPMLSSVDAFSEMPCSSTLVDSLSQLQHPFISMEALQQECSVSGRTSVPVDVSREAAYSDNHGDEVSWMDDRRLEKEDDRPVLATSKEIGIAESSRQLRNKVVSLVAADETAEESQENNDLLPRPTHDFTVNENDDNDEVVIGEEAANLKCTRQTSKKLAPGLEKTGRGRKKVSEGSESLDKEPPKKKFSHSTRRNKRRVDKVLLETPKHEINPRELVLRDLILLAEAKERLLVADPNAGNNSSPHQSTTFTQDTPFEEDVPFAYEEDQAELSVQPKLNYHTFMNKTSKERWSKQDTDLFYEGIQQFGTDFALIQQLFPGRTRHQVKLKYKKEERQQPMRLSDALTNRSNNHSHFKLVIERLQKAAADAEAEHDSNREDGSVGITGEEEEVTPNSNEEVSKKHDENEANIEEEEVGEGVMEAEEVATANHLGYSPAISPQESEEEDVYDIWSEYKSDI
ncbi:hypothetical protein MKW94_024777 [Papaver nudicaule]|uniref:SANT domain-containing protein n=1 Tax=Papaver nudicaule TaxID=74823 RepID=A0AA42AWL1_PAPNU|nr:hypothetical protein [Papaver nudicaule]